MNKDKSEIDDLIKEYGQNIPVPLELLINPKYTASNNFGKNRLEHSRAILYGFLTTLPKQKDENGREFVETSIHEIEIVTGVTDSVPSKMLKELEDFALIERKPTKAGQRTQLYVKQITR